MSKIIFMKGLPGSGKSFISREYMKTNPNTLRVNKDDLRTMLSNGGFNKKLEKIVVLAEQSIAEEALFKGFDVIVDDTNFNPYHEERFREVAKKFDAEFAIIEMSTPIEECIKRDSLRENPVGEEVICSMVEKWGVK